MPTLCDTFQARSTWTNGIIAAGYTTKLGILEETITDIHLLEFGQSHQGQVWTKKYTKKQEASVSGADWLWCIGKRGSWLLLLVQAKIVDPRTHRCRYLNYRNGQQRQRLVQYARTIRAYPTYCIYSYLDGSFHPGAPPGWAGPPIPLEQWGCTLLTPRAVRELVQRGQRHHRDVLLPGVPWMVPFCSAAATAGAQRDWARLLAAGLAQARASTSMEVSRPRALGRRVRWEDPDPRRLVSNKFPNVAANLLAGYGTRLRSETVERPLVSAISVLSSESLREVMSAFDSLRTREERRRLLTNEL